MSERDGGPQCDDLDFSPRIRFPEVIRAEYAEINKRRQVAAKKPVTPSNARPTKMAGVSLSGGGIRSATFNLGMLQALAKAKKLDDFDYLSTVSGGGYTGGWYSAWLARDEQQDPPDTLFPPDEKIASERDDRRAAMEAAGYEGGVDRQQVKDSAISAAVDPIHHLRLFSNFLTPRIGILSGDTWRAAAVTSRNIVLTWLILLPIILAAIVAGQAWFALALGDSTNYLVRLGFALFIPAMLLVGNIAAVNVWMVATRRLITWGDLAVVIVTGIGFVALTASVLTTWGVPSVVILGITALILLWTLYVFGRLIFWQKREHPEKLDDAYWRNRLLRIQTRTLAYAVFSAVVLLFAGFGHILFQLLIDETRMRSAQAGGWGALALSLLSAAYTAYKNSPTGGADPKGAEEPSKVEKIIFALAPYLFLLTIGIVLSWVGNALYERIRHEYVLVVAYAALVAAFLFLVVAIYEFRPRQRWLTLIPLSVVWIAAVWVALQKHVETDVLLNIAFWTLVALALILLYRAALRRRWWIVGYALLLAVFAALVWFIPPSGYVEQRLAQLVVAGVISTLALLVIEVFLGRGANTRCIALSIIGCTIFVLVGAAACIPDQLGRNALTLISMLAVTLGWVVALGWLADPNALTIHAFYKARLIRAYMGASNAERGRATEADITDAVPGDDVLLTQLRNADRGAPYHLINAMLNLVGSSDLSTQARASDSFLFSKLYCGSVRTGFRKTNEYACGSISLGTAIAASGAAASPVMGAKTPNAALTALLTLFNVRIGYWTPTPNLSYWRSASTRLWPFYTTQELIAQTTDLLPYCYLTDGGHYENSGVYALIERGCNLIVLGDAGGDPDTTLEDLGNLIRKVRIDFGADIRISDDDIKRWREKLPDAHVIEGQIIYDDRHMAAIGLPENEKEARLIIVKPNLSGGEPVDVKQYGWLNTDFPQQSTFDLWYDEAQFESYRSLGQLSGEKAVALL